MSEVNRHSAIMHLINDPLFADFEDMQAETSFFNVVGRTHTETWHSATLGWLLNPSSNHGLGDFPLRRFILTMMNKEDPKSNREVSLSDITIDGDLSAARARPNESDLQEVTISSIASRHDKKGKIDVFVDGIVHLGDSVKILIEMKVNSKIDQDQCAKYVAYILEREQETKNREVREILYPVFVSPDWNLGDNRFQLFGSNQWIVIDFQTLYDDLIAPCMQSGRLSEFGRVFLDEYTKTLKYPNAKKGNRRMATTDREVELAHKIYAKHGNAIDALIELLRLDVDLGEPSTTEKRPQRKKPIIRITIDGETIEATSIPELYTLTLEFLKAGGYLQDLQLPVSTGYGRHLIAAEPTHPRGNAFLKPVEVDGVYMEAHKSREGGINDLFKFLETLGLEATNVSPKE
ncbi:MAG: PD-(D/E)XK nuclease family protein [Phototrophicaceae bacterium]